MDAGRRWAAGRALSWGLMVCLGVIGFHAGRAAAQENDADKLKRGDILIRFEKNPFSDLTAVTGVILFDAPPGVVWKVITDYPGYARFVPDIGHYTLERQEGQTAWYRVVVRNLWPYPAFDYRVKIVHQEAQGLIEWALEDGNIKAFSGSWKIEPFAGDPARTLAAYSLLLDSGWSLFDLPTNMSNRSLVLERLDAFNAEILLEKKRLEGEPGKVIQPFWRKSPFARDEIKPPRVFKTEKPKRPPEPAPVPQP